ncbi:hypothetical protein GUJ93_ZPchr0010g10552 [Zizania palustris]|uniref:Uncharacterized protein n=1 Tax=Zizania palustris TaxID=103762 RepID=A0A8J6BH67_ZIZPA|nr:hypothetical protein GUJ93_ZPchr0010g10552 [Zizania palustris]
MWPREQRSATPQVMQRGWSALGGEGTSHIEQRRLSVQTLAMAGAARTATKQATRLHDTQQMAAPGNGGSVRLANIVDLASVTCSGVDLSDDEVDLVLATGSGADPIGGGIDLMVGGDSSGVAQKLVE